jgi:hypothetical protein
VRDQVLLLDAVPPTGVTTILRMPRVVPRNSTTPSISVTVAASRGARLEQLGHARQTAGDVALCADFARDLRQHRARPRPLAVLHQQDGAGGMMYSASFWPSSRS